MPHSFKLSRRIARFRAPVIATVIVSFCVSLFACNSSDSLNPDLSTTAEPIDGEQVLTDEGGVALAPAGGPEAAISFAGGIPMGTFAQPTSTFGSVYNGAHRNIGPYALRNELASIRSRGGKVVLMMAGSQKYYKNSDGSFSFSKWKERINRYRQISFGEFINDGTIIAHYLIDEPHDARNFGGKAIPGQTLEEMARYSKSIWPNLKTVVRDEPYMIKWSGRYQHLDAAWAQYLRRKGVASDYIRKNVASAKEMGLGLIVGMNIRHGGSPNLTWMTPSEVESWGSDLLSSDYPCAFISWQYDSDKLNSQAMKDAMSKLRRKAQSRPSRSCSG